MTAKIDLAAAFLLLISVSVFGDDNLSVYHAEASAYAKLSQLMHDFDEFRLPSPHASKIVFSSERYSYSGNTKDLNHFLARISDLADTLDITVFLQGPQGNMLGEPLTAAAAQVCADYDWRVHVLHGKVQILVPLAKEIPFSRIEIPKSLGVEADFGAPGIASKFSELHQKEKESR